MTERNKELMLEFLHETQNHYNLNNRSTLKGGCVYISDCSKGCAIGRKLPKWAKDEIIELNINSATSVIELISRLPKLKESPLFNLPSGFLLDIQMLHDVENNWTEKGISESGKLEVSKIEESVKRGDYKSDIINYDESGNLHGHYKKYNTIKKGGKYHLHLEGNYKGGKKHGEWKSYWTNGQLYYHTHYKEGVECGKWSSWSMDGKLKASGEK